MRVAILADGRSPITKGWLETLRTLDVEIHLLSTFPCDVQIPLASQHLVPIAFSGMKRESTGNGRAAPGGAASIQLRAAVRRWLGMATFPSAVTRLRKVLGTLDVDLLHALRIPYEGMLAAEADPEMPLILSVWGNDFTLHARSAPWMRWLTRRAMTRAEGLHADCQRDIRLAREWGLRESLPTLVAPGGGGLTRSVFFKGPAEIDRLSPEHRARLSSIPPDVPFVINPRGFRSYVRNDTFFNAIPIILGEFPQVKFIAPAMLGEKLAERWLDQLGIARSMILLPHLSAEEIAVLYRRSQVVVSPSEHDGTPNSFLEAIACGCFPVVGDLESLREWVDDGHNGFLINPQDPESLAVAVIRALRDGELRERAAQANQTIIDERAERGRVGRWMKAFYDEVLARTRPTSGSEVI